MNESEKILMRYGYTVDSFENEIIKPLKKSGTVDIICSRGIVECIINTAFRYFDMCIDAKHIDGLDWRFFVKTNESELSLAEIYFGKFN